MIKETAIYEEVIKFLELYIQKEPDIIEDVGIEEIDPDMTELQEMVPLSDEKEVLFKIAEEEEIRAFVGGDAEKANKHRLKIEKAEKEKKDLINSGFTVSVPYEKKGKNKKEIR